MNGGWSINSEVGASGVLARLREAVRWSQFKYLLLINCLITMVLVLLGLPLKHDNPGLVIFANFLYSMCIGSGIYFLVNGVGVYDIKNRLFFFPAISLTIVLGGLMGAMLASSLASALFGWSGPFDNPGRFLIQAAMSSLLLGGLAFSFMHLKERLQETASRLAEKELAERELLHSKTEAELSALRARIQPHFLFNTLNSIAGTIHDQPDLAEELVQKLSNLLRVAVSSGKQEWVTLEEELELVSSYLIIEGARLGERLRYQVHLEPGLENVPIPVLLLQPLVENSVQHGIAPKAEGGSLTVHCSQCESGCRIEIVDDGRGWDPASFREGFGLGGVRERLALHYGDAAELNISNDGGVSLVLVLPAISTDEVAP